MNGVEYREHKKKNNGSLLGSCLPVYLLVGFIVRLLAYWYIFFLMFVVFLYSFGEGALFVCCCCWWCCFSIHVCLCE